MTFDLGKILESKHAYRRRLAQLPIPEKLRMLDQLQERALELRKIRELNRKKQFGSRAD